MSMFKSPQRMRRVVIRCESCPAALDLKGVSPEQAHAIASTTYGWGFVKRRGLIETYCIRHLLDMPPACDIEAVTA